MSSAVITYCGHFFHGNCLRKWLYVQETCPMCHQAIRATFPGRAQASGGHGDEDNEASQETQRPPAVPAPTEEQMEIGSGTNHQPGEPQGDNRHHFSPSRDLSLSCASGATLRLKVHKKDEEGDEASPLPSSSDAAGQNGRAEITETDFKPNGVPQSDNGESESCGEAHGSQSGRKSRDSSSRSLFNSQTEEKSLKENFEGNDDSLTVLQ